MSDNELILNDLNDADIAASADLMPFALFACIYEVRFILIFLLMCANCDCCILCVGIRNK